MNPEEKQEIRDTLLTFIPAVMLAFVLRWVLVTSAAWPSRRATLTSIGAGIVLALVLQQLLRRRAGR